jgi:SAM-dependent methyltransferase
MMTGTRECFDYFECGSCGCLQITKIPVDISRHYAGGYYSVKRQGAIKRYLQDRRIEFLLTERGFVGRVVAAFRPRERNEAIAPTGVAKNARVLEVGCGNGYYLLKLLELGFKHLHGIDPYMDPSYIRERPVRLHRTSLLDLSVPPESYDCVVFGHTLEHIAEQRETLVRAAELLDRDGVLIIGIPWAESWAWEHYGVDWVQLDAPRHFFLHTSRSFKRLADDAGLYVQDVEHNSTAFQFWGSEQYRRDIPLHAPESWVVNPRRSPFRREQIRQFEERAQLLNREQRGDQVTVFLRKAVR